MQCDSTAKMLDAYLDGELSQDASADVANHLKGCTVCSAQIAETARLRHAVHAVRGHFTPTSDFRARIQKQVAPRRRGRWALPWISAAAAVAAVFIAALLYVARTPRSDAFAEMADLHVNALASANQVDVVSTDRHTVKPWFQGRIPFSFNVPELGTTEFTLVGGRMVYFHQQPGAQLIVAYGQHRISVLIFQNSAEIGREFPQAQTVDHRTSFGMETLRSGNLRFVFVSDADPSGIARLAQLFEQANQ